MSIRTERRPRADGAVPEWGIDPVPDEHKLLSGLDVAVLWGDLGIGLLVIVVGALLVPGLGFTTAMVAIVLGSILGCALLALGGAMGAKYGVPTMVLFRPSLGMRGSWIPSWLNALQLVGWTAVELWAMSLVADLVARRYFDISVRPLWLGLATLVCTVLALWGPVGVARIWMKRFGAWVIVSISVVVTVLVLTSGGLSDMLGAPGTGGWPTLGAAVDLVIAMPISWLPLVADYNRFARSSGAAFAGTFGGYLVANIWMYALGAMLLLSGGADPSPTGVAAGILAVAGGSFAGILFLIGLLVGETDEAFADIYSGAVSVQNVFPQASQRVIVVAIAAASAGLAAFLTMDLYETFLFLIGSVFIPMFGILAADYVSARKRHIDVGDLYRLGGPYWYTAGIRLRAVLPLVAGFVVYHWVQPTGPSWWVEGVASVIGTPLGERFGWLSASLPSLAVAFLLGLQRPGSTIIPVTRRDSIAAAEPTRMP